MTKRWGTRLHFPPPSYLIHLIQSKILWMWVASSCGARIIHGMLTDSRGTRQSLKSGVLMQLAWLLSGCLFCLWPARWLNSVPSRLVSCVGAYVCKGRSGWLIPLGEALCENAELQLSIPMKFKRAPPLPPPPGPAMCTLLLDMLASDPDARPLADQLEARVRSALKEDSHWHKVGWRDHNGYNHHSHYMEVLTVDPPPHPRLQCLLHV